jgi:hypothetical protein
MRPWQQFLLPHFAKNGENFNRDIWKVMSKGPTIYAYCGGYVHG